MPYAELHCHTAYSFLDGASHPQEIAGAAAEQGHSALAVTDHDGLHGAMEAAQALKPLGVRPITGAEVSMEDGSHLTLLCETRAGYTNLCRLLTEAHAGTRPHPDREPLDPVTTYEALERHSEGIVCLSGCARHGPVARAVEAGDHAAAGAAARRLKRIFGPDRLRIELQRPFARHDRRRNRLLSELAERIGVACVATGDVHSHSRGSTRLQDALVAVRLGRTLDECEPVRRGNSSSALASPEAMAARFAEHPEAVHESGRLAERLTFDLTSDLGYSYPGAEDEHADRKLADVCAHRLDERYPRGHERARARLDEELAVIRHLGLSGFFLLHRDMLELAREVAAEVRGADEVRAILPPGRGRGSSVASIVCYLTGLSHIDPLANELHLGRFLNEDLTALPDIDLDFPRDIREVLIPRVHERYGHDRSALVAAFATYQVRSAVRDFAKALGLPPGEIERLARTVDPWKPGNDVGGRRAGWLAALAGAGAARPHGRTGCRATSPSTPAAWSSPPSRWSTCARSSRRRWRAARWCSGTRTPAPTPASSSSTCWAWGCCRRSSAAWWRSSARATSGSTCRGSTSTTREVYAAIQAAETTGVFQIESRAQMSMLPRTHPENLDDLTVQVALVRPGPIQGGAVHPYIERKKALREDPSFQVPYEHPSLEPVLKDTLGAIVFQDQVIEVAMAFAGFTAGDAEGLRRAMSRKRSEAAMRAYESQFIEGAVERGADAETAQRVYDQIVGFSGFGFPKSHSAAFGLLAYQSTWLRVHYGPEFLCALMNEQPMGFYPSDALVHEAQRRGIEVLPPCVSDASRPRTSDLRWA